MSDIVIKMDEVDTEFYLAYGRAMANWAELERALCNLFIRLTGMKSDIAWDIFYSARSLQGRVDMVQVAIPYARTIPAGREFLVRATRIISSYAAVRNSMAHDPHGLQMDMTHPTGMRRYIRSTKKADPVFLEHLQRAALSFAWLAILIHVSFGSRKLLRDGELSLAALDLLPDDPAETPLDLGRANAISTQIAQLPG